MIYILDDKKFSLNYIELRWRFNSFCMKTNEEFIEALPDAIHLACVICWLKGIGEQAISDVGIIHQLVHLLNFDDPVITVNDVRKQFKEDLKLA